jgi:restriction system protein
MPLRVMHTLPMPIPDFQSTMLPLLRDLSQGERTGQETLDALAKHFALTPDELAQRLPSGKQTTFTNRIAWAKSHLKGAGLVASPRRGVHTLTDRGLKILAGNPPSITMKDLMQFPEYVAFRFGSGATEPEVGTSKPSTASAPVESRTPDDLIEDGYRQLRGALAAELRGRIQTMPPAAFEQLVVDLLTAMGYGGPQEDSGLVVGGGGDEGVDGVIREDRLGLETIYIQAKRWQDTVGRPEIQKFAGALQGQRARKGVFITTSSFSKDALAYASAIQTTIVLVDGRQLAELMIDHGVGVTPIKRFEIKRVDSDYFTVE